MMDIRIDNHGSIVLITPVSEEGQAWVDEHLAHPEIQMWGNAVVAEPRYVAAIVEGAQNDGLEVG